jgi:hypothetical protein
MTLQGSHAAIISQRLAESVITTFTRDYHDVKNLRNEKAAQYITSLYYSLMLKVSKFIKNK